MRLVRTVAGACVVGTVLSACGGGGGNGGGSTGEAVRQAVARLSPALRDVVELGVFQGLPYADVGEVLGIPVGTVKSRMFHALRKLKEFLS